MQEKKKINIYPSFILLLLGSFLLFSTWSAYHATGLGIKVTDSSYYSKGLHYTASERAAGKAQHDGWHLQASLTGHTLNTSLSDRNALSISHARGSLYLAIPGKAENIHLPFTEVSPGHYQLRIARSIHGSTQGLVSFSRNDTHLERRVLLNL